MYIACKTQSDIVFTIECLSQNFINIKIKYIKVTKQVMWYLKEITNYELRYKLVINIHTNQNIKYAHNYVDSNYVEDIVN